MAGHGSDPPEDRSHLSARQVTRNSGMYSSREMHPDYPGIEMHIQEYRPPVGGGTKRSDNGTRYSWQVNQGPDASIFKGTARSGSVRTLKRAKAAARSGARRYAEGRDRFTGR